MKRNRSLCLSVTAICLSCSVSSADTLYVKVSGSGTQDCLSWTNACTLATVLDPNHPIAESGDEVWVAAGTYSGPIALVDAVKIIGGFAGWETAASQSDPKVNQTVIDGNCTLPGTHRCITSTNDSASTMLRGFRITGGCDESELMDDTGGGGGVLLLNSNAMFVQCVFDGNTSKAWGGAVYVRGTGSPEFINCKFDGNGAVQVGVDAQQQPIIRTPFAGGAVYVHSGSPRFTNCLFTDNTGMEAGGIAVKAGAPELFNCTLSENQATIGYGGGMYDPLGRTTVKNCIFYSDTAVRGNKEVENYPGRFTKATASDIEDGFPGTGNIGSDPLFEVAVGDYRLQSTSPCRDAGIDASLPPDVADLDWDGNTTENVVLNLDLLARIASTKVDIGAYEYRECATDTDCTGGDVCCEDLCEACCDDADCDDGLFCSGVETCSSNSCQAGSYPCAAGQICSETFDVCGCVVNAECSDGLFCNGPEVCVNGSCEAGADPCPGQFCDEVAKVCVWCNHDSDCQAGEMCCSGNCQECCNNMDCPGTLNLCCPSQGFVCSTTCPQ